MKATHERLVNQRSDYPCASCKFFYDIVVHVNGVRYLPGPYLTDNMLILVCIAFYVPEVEQMSPPVKLTFHHHHFIDMTLAVTEALRPNKPNLDMTLAVTEALSPNKPNLDMTLAVTEALRPNKPNLDMTLAVTEALSPNKPNLDMTLAVSEALSLNKPIQTSI